MNSIPLLLFSCFWSALVLLFDVTMARHLWKQFESGHYPSTVGEITHSEMKIHHGKGMSYGIDIRYDYVVNGRSFNGRTFRYDTLSSSYDWAASTVNEHPVHSQTKVYFNPDDPSDSVLSPNLEGGDLMLPMFLIPFNLIMAGLLTATGASLRRTAFQPLAGGVKIIVDGPRTNIRLPQYGALVWGMIATGGFSLAAMFIVGFSTGFRPSMTTACLALFLVFAGGVAVYIRQWRKIHSGDDDLILDETSATIALPETFGRKQRVTVDRNQIEKLTVERIEHHSNKGGVSFTYAPTLWVRRNGGIESEKLADWMDRNRAEAFTEWLGQRLNLPGALAEAARIS